MASPSPVFAEGQRRRKSAGALPRPEPSCVMKGMSVFPSRAAVDRKVRTGPAKVPHQLGDPTRMTS